MAHSALFELVKLRHLCRMLDLPRPYAVGLLECLAYYVSHHNVTGDISNLSDSEIEEAAEWPGESGAFLAAALECRFIDRDENGTRLHDWADWAPDWVKKRLKRLEASGDYRRPVAANGGQRRPTGANGGCAGEKENPVADPQTPMCPPSAANGGQREPTAANGGIEKRREGAGRGEPGREDVCVPLSPSSEEENETASEMSRALDELHEPTRSNLAAALELHGVDMFVVRALREECRQAGRTRGITNWRGLWITRLQETIRDHQADKQEAAEEEARDEAAAKESHARLRAEYERSKGEIDALMDKLTDEQRTELARRVGFAGATGWHLGLAVWTYQRAAAESMIVGAEPGEEEKPDDRT